MGTPLGTKTVAHMRIAGAVATGVGEVADLKAAGLEMIAVTGSAAVTAAVGTRMTVVTATVTTTVGLTVTAVGVIVGAMIGLAGMARGVVKIA